MKHLPLSRPACGSHRKVRGEVIKVVKARNCKAGPFEMKSYFYPGHKIVRDRYGRTYDFIDGSIHGLSANFKKGTKVWVQVQWGPSYSLPFAWIRKDGE